MKYKSIILGDCLEKLNDIDANSIDMIYLDPPFFTGKDFYGTSKDEYNKYYFRDTWNSYLHYDSFIKERLFLCKKVLKDSGSIFVHCDKNAVHRIRILLDDVFGEDNFRSDIIWYYKRWSNSKKGLLSQHQNILFYSKTKNFKWNAKFINYSNTTNIDQNLQKRKKNKLGISSYAKDNNGEVIYGNSKKGVPLGDVWEIPFLNPKAKERTGYPTQKPVILLERLIELTTDINDIVLDPFCGSGTTLVAAKLLERNFIGIDISEQAISLTKHRLNNIVKTESKLLTLGAEYYNNNDKWVLEHLSGFDFIRVHRNKGLDAILKIESENTIFARVQRESESIDEAYFSLENALKSKPKSIGFLIKTDINSDIYNSSNRIKIINSLSRLI